MTNQPLNSSDQSKILMFSLLCIPAVLLLAGAVPVLFLVFGVFMMKKHEDFSHVATAVRNFRVYTWLCLLPSALSAAYCATTLNAEHSSDRLDKHFEVSLVLSVICIIYLLAVKVLFLSPLKGHRDWVEVNGIFSNKPKLAGGRSDSESEMDIIKGEKLKQYSVADELLKWAKLKEDGHISEDEFREARAQLLKRS